MERRVRHGGLMRCCLATLDEYCDAHEGPDPIGMELPCKYCKSAMIVAPDGAWEWKWNRESTR